MTIEEHRAKFDYSVAKLRRARWIYIRLIYRTLMDDMTGQSLWTASERMVACGLYRGPCMKCVRHSILRKMWRMTPGYEKGRGYFQWLDDTGFDLRRKLRVKIVRRAA